MAKKGEAYSSSMYNQDKYFCPCGEKFRIKAVYLSHIKKCLTYQNKVVAEFRKHQEKAYKEVEPSEARKKEIDKGFCAVRKTNSIKKIKKFPRSVKIKPMTKSEIKDLCEVDK